MIAGISGKGVALLPLPPRREDDHFDFTPGNLRVVPLWMRRAMLQSVSRRAYADAMKSYSNHQAL